MKSYKGYTQLVLRINGQMRKAVVSPNDTLLYVLREKLGLTGAKPGCENGDCGACTVLMDGKPVKSCIILAVEAEGHELTTIEGLKDTPIQRAFVEEAAFQCGYCTPGFIMNAHAMLNTVPNADDDTIKEWLSSNICRCTGYEEIKRAVAKAQKIAGGV